MAAMGVYIGQTMSVMRRSATDGAAVMAGSKPRSLTRKR